VERQRTLVIKHVQCISLMTRNIEKSHGTGVELLFEGSRVSEKLTSFPGRPGSPEGPGGPARP